MLRPYFKAIKNPYTFVVKSSYESVSFFLFRFIEVLFSWHHVCSTNESNFSAPIREFVHAHISLPL